MLQQHQNSLLVDLSWMTNALFQDQLITQEQVNIVRSTARTKEQIHWHPIALIASHGFELARSVATGANNSRALPQARTLDISQLTYWLAEKAGIEIFHIDPLKLNVQEVTKVMSLAFSQRHHVLAVEVYPEEVVLVTDQPFYHEWKSGLHQIIRDKRFTVKMTNPQDLSRYRVEFYNLSKSVSGATLSGNAASSGLPGIHNFEQLFELGDLKSADANDQHIVNIVDWLLQYAFDQRASDIHLEPRRDLGNIRFRIDGVLHDVYNLPTVVHSAVTSRIKILGRMNVAEKRRPQDGRLKTKMPKGQEVELRLSTLPTAFGEKMVMRIFDPQVLVRNFSELGFSAAEHRKWRKMVKQPNGIVLVTGPTGSGKTTTLYSTLKDLATSQVNVCTLEDPIEMVEPAFNQVQIQAQIEMGFAQGIRAVLRQDPDIVMVGEIRELATAEMAIQAALTGHLVISTLHTNDSPSAVTRLLDLGVPSYLISATVLGVMAQRLVRTLCPHCKQPEPLDEALWKRLTHPWKSSIPEQVFKPVGCVECRDTGYHGRIGIYETLEFNDSIKQLVSNEGSLQELARQGYQSGMLPLRINGAQKVGQGLCTIEEILRVTPEIITGSRQRSHP